MKLAIIRQRYTPFGGAERFIERALGALVAQGAEISLITRSWEGAPRDGFRQVICDPPYSRLLGGRAARDRSFARAALAAMQAGHYDLVQSHERIPGCSIFRAGDGVHAAWLDHRRRTLPAWQAWAERFSSFHRAVLDAERRMLADPALRAVICNSQLVADELVQYYNVPRDRLAVIYNGVDTESFHPRLAAGRLAARQPLGLPPEAPVLLFVGSGFARKGVPALLQAFAALERRDARLLIVGADRKLRAMQALAQRLGVAERVMFTGPVQDVRPFYGLADGFVLPTVYDPCPNAVLEALACGLPVVTSTSCGAREWITAGQNGWVTDALDISALSRAMQGLCDWQGHDAPRAAARASVAHLTLEAMAGALLALYAQLLGH